MWLLNVFKKNNNNNELIVRLDFYVNKYAKLYLFFCNFGSFLQIKNDFELLSDCIKNYEPYYKIIMGVVLSTILSQQRFRVWIPVEASLCRTYSLECEII